MEGHGSRSTRRRYTDIADALRGRIKEGLYQPGSPIPRNVDLVEEFQSSPRTITRASEVLRREGLIENRGRYGLTVIELRTRRKYTVYVGADEACEYSKMWRLGDASVEKTLWDGLTRPPGDIADLMGVEGESQLRHRRYLRWDDQGPTELIDSWTVPSAVAARPATQHDRLVSATSPPIPRDEVRTGCAQDGDEDWWEVAAPTAEQVSTLQLRPAVPVWLHRRIFRAKDGGVDEVVDAAVAGDRLRLTHRGRCAAGT